MIPEMDDERRRYYFGVRIGYRVASAEAERRASLGRQPRVRRLRRRLGPADEQNRAKQIGRPQIRASHSCCSLSEGVRYETGDMDASFRDCYPRLKRKEKGV